MKRREFISSGTALLAMPSLAFAQANTEKRFVFILQRGAADGLHTVIPYAEPAYARLRGALAIDPSQALKVDGTFALHPALEQLHQLFGAGEASFFHAVASAYRDRSHFDGQNVLESGGRGPYQLKDGWLNRMVGLLHPKGKPPIALASAIPLVLQGKQEVVSYAPSALPQVNDDLLVRVEQLYANDAQLHGLWTAAQEARTMAGSASARENRQGPAALGSMAASFLARADGPRIAVIESNGWDTHSAQLGRLGAQLTGLDKLVGALKLGLGAAWAQTVVLVATEFGRTAAVNGTGGTDHGTASAAMLLGGLVQGGSVQSDWPGLENANLLDGRDLKPTLALEVLIAQLCAQLYGVEHDLVARTLFPGGPKGALKSRLLRS